MSIKMNLDNIRKILVLQQRQLGDVLLTSPALHLLKKRFPEAEIDFFTELKCEPLLRHNPNITNLICLNKKELKNLWAEYKYYKKIATNAYDLLINFQNLPRCFNISLLSKSKIKIAPTGSFWRRIAYTHTYDIAKDYAAASKVGLLKDLDIKYTQEKLELFLLDSEINQAQELLKDLGLQKNHKLITLDSTHRRITRRYNPEKFAKVMELLYKQDQNFRFFILRGPNEEEQIAELTNCINHKEMLLIAKQVPDLRISAGVISLAKMHLGNLSAPHHIAEAVGTPYLTIRGSTGDEWVYPSPEHLCVALNLACQPCYSNKCTHIDCLQKLEPEYIADLFLKHYQKYAK